MSTDLGEGKIVTFITHVVVTVPGFCLRHNRFLTYKEFDAKSCFWCHPQLNPQSKIHKMSAEEKQKLVVNPKAPTLP